MSETGIKITGLTAMVGIIAIIVGIFVYNTRSSEPDKPVRGSNAEYQDCVESASKHLFDMIPGMTMEQAISQAETSPRCSAIRSGN